MQLCVVACSHESMHLFQFPLLVCMLCANCTCVNKCADGIWVARSREDCYRSNSHALPSFLLTGGAKEV